LKTFPVSNRAVTKILGEVSQESPVKAEKVPAFRGEILETKFDLVDRLELGAAQAPHLKASKLSPGADDLGNERHRRPSTPHVVSILPRTESLRHRSIYCSKPNAAEDLSEFL